MASQAMTVSVDEAAEALGISRGLAFKLAAKGELPGARRLGRRVLVSRAALEEFLRADSSSLADQEATRG